MKEKTKKEIKKTLYEMFLFMGILGGFSYYLVSTATFLKDLF